MCDLTDDWDFLLLQLRRMKSQPGSDLSLHPGAPDTLPTCRLCSAFT